MNIAELQKRPPVALLRETGWFDKPGCYAIVDGQFGSTGKGAAAVIVAMAGGRKVTVCTSNAGPNSGHTGYLPYDGAKIVTRQLPVSAFVLQAMGCEPAVYLNGGAVIDASILMDEMTALGINRSNMYVHPCAAVITPDDIRAEASGTVAAVASTGKGVGAAIAKKVLRAMIGVPLIGVKSRPLDWDWSEDYVVMEVPQGFSLGLNEARFYPKVTSRECTVAQGLADARIPPASLRKTMMVCRSYPIRVGNTDKGTSGGHYPDQDELTWEKIGQKPEYTTVTGRERRLFSWSRMQFKEAVAANQPEALFLSFMDYLPRDKIARRVMIVCEDYRKASIGDKNPEAILLSFGPRPEDVMTIAEWSKVNQ